MVYIISNILGNFTLALFIMAILIGGLKSIRNKKEVAEIFYRWLSLLPLGLGGIYSFFMHAFFGDFTAAQIGWANSPFQYEVAIANLGFGLVAILAFSKKASYGFRLANIIGAACWLWGDAIGHIHQMIKAHNFSSGNAGSWFWMDVILPLTLIICLYYSNRQERIVLSR